MPQSYSPVDFPQDWSAVSMSASNQVTDSCSDDADNNVGNYTTINPFNMLGGNTPVISNGNTTFTRNGTASDNQQAYATQAAVGKKYWEFNVTANTNSIEVGWAAPGEVSGNEGAGASGWDVEVYLLNINAAGGGGPWYIYMQEGTAGSATNTQTSIDSSEVTTTPRLKFAIDTDAKKYWLGVVDSTYGGWFNTSGVGGQTFSEAAPTGTWTSDERFVPYVFGHAQTEAGTFHFRDADWTDSAPSGFTALSTANTPAPTVTDSSEFFKAVTFSGTGSAQNVDTIGFRPDLLIIKSATSSANWNWVDSVRGASELLWSNATVAQSEETSSVTGFRDAGFSVGSDTGSYVNISGQTMVTYGLKAGGATTSSNTDGSITSEVTAASHGGFSIAKYTGTGANGTFGHGCSRAPKFILVRAYEQAYSWSAWHEGLTSGDYVIYLSSAAAESDQGGVAWQSTPPSSSVITLGSQTGQNGSGQVHICYSFARTPGLIGIGSYTGNGSADGPMVVVDDGASGFKPAWIMFKNISQAGYGWSVFDVARDTIGNPSSTALAVNNSTSNSSVASYKHDVLANGFKIRGNSGETNYSGNRIIYLAFAENPFGGSGIAQAKAR